ncbi:acetyl-CoA synthetase [Candidatus Magnetomorum sp. HK-1]|nr:acetyl-CoA synthetase [Candidatus Magnetomorum sp. HK-1]
MTQEIYKTKDMHKKNTLCDNEKYLSMYKQSIENPDAFWGKIAERIDWFEPFTRVKDSSFDDEVNIKWFLNGKLNVSYNCLDRHLETRGDQVAIIFEGNDPGVDKKFTYQELYVEVCKFANVLKTCGVKKGDRVSIYLPMIPELAIAMLACTRIGAIHSIVFAGFSPDALAGRIEDAGCSILITSDEGLRGNKKVPLKVNADAAMEKTSCIKKCIVVSSTNADINMKQGRDVWWEEMMATADTNCPPEHMDAEDPLFILYTSGSTGQPKGVLHTTGGYIVYTSFTHEYVFDYHENDIYWCTADIGWITGHSYIVYGPLANGATTLMFEGVPNYPDFSRFWQICDKHEVNIFYTAPTAIRALMQQGEKFVKQSSRKSIRLLGTVGEPINPEAWQWYYKVVGEERCQIVDTWWQTETGGILITPLPGAIDLKPGSATKPFFGVQPALIGKDGKVIKGPGEGHLVMLDSWPSIARSVYGDHDRFITTYFSQYPGMYFTGDGAKRDSDGYYWITGRVDDVINVSGHRLGTAEIESALVSHPSVSEAAVVGYPHEIKGQGIYAYVTLTHGYSEDDELKDKLVKWVRQEIGPIASPGFIQFSPALPKTRSGKIMRRILRKVACDEIDNLGDTSTLADPTVVNELVENRLASFDCKC